MRAFAESGKRPIRTAGDLHAVIIESLQRYEQTLHGTPPSLELWNAVKQGRRKVWDPKDEDNLSNCLKVHLERDLDQRGLVAHREVQIRQRLGHAPSQLVDILVSAVPIAADGGLGKVVTVVIEVKCAWNDGVLDDMERQLYARYLDNNECDFGVYVVAFFTCTSWNRQRDARRKSGASRMGIEDLRTRLRAQANGLSSSEKRIESLVIDARITKS